MSNDGHESRRQAMTSASFPSDSSPHNAARLLSRTFLQRKDTCFHDAMSPGMPLSRRSGNVQHPLRSCDFYDAFFWFFGCEEQRRILREISTEFCTDKFDVVNFLLNRRQTDGPSYEQTTTPYGSGVWCMQIGLTS